MVRFGVGDENWDVSSPSGDVIGAELDGPCEEVVPVMQVSGEHICAFAAYASFQLTG